MEQQLLLLEYKPRPLDGCTALGSLVTPQVFQKGALDKALIDAGWAEIGNGCYCTAYLSPDGDRVIKVGCGYGQRATIEAAMRHPDNPHLPTVYGFLDLEENGSFAVECEVLEDLPEDDFDEDEEEWGSSKYLAWRRKWRPYYLNDHANAFRVRPRGPMKDALRALFEARDNWGVLWDVHSGNVMVRPSTGELVLNDLLA